MGSTKGDHRGVLAVEGCRLRILARNVAVDGPVSAGGAVEDARDVGDANVRRGRDQLDERELVHEIVEELAVVHQVGLRNVKGLGLLLFGGWSDSGQSQTGEQIAALHSVLPGLRNL